MAAAPSPVSVFARVRPLTPVELRSDASELPGLRLSSSDAAAPEAKVYDDAANGGFTAIGGFTGVLGTAASNHEVLERCFEPQLGSVLRGGAASLFCYGYTGSGKTHTVIGYGEERGIYFLAAEQLLHQLAATGAEDLFLQASVCELYNDEVFDLLGPQRVACTLRMDEDGQLQVVGSQTSVSLPGSETAGLEELLLPEQRQGFFATIVTRTAGLRTASVYRGEDLQQISGSCVQHRAVGSSTEHSQSSRSHALLRMEVVNEAILAAQAKIDEAKATIAPRKNVVDNVMMCKFQLLWTIAYGIFPPSTAVDKTDYHPSHPDAGFHDPDDGYLIEAEGIKPGLYPLKGFENIGAKSLEDWAKHFGVPELGFGFTRLVVQHDEPGRWEALKSALDAKAVDARERLRVATAQLEAAMAELEEVRAQGHAALGGSLLLVDLAGADYDHRSGREQKESAAINKSLLSLKECFRSLAKGSGAKAKFRDSKLTRLLEDSLAPSACSQRRNRESVSVMLVNVSPAEHLGKMTLNALRYGQIFAAADEPRRCAPKQSARQPKVGAKPTAKPKAAPPECDLQLREEIVVLYRQHCPEKSDHDIEVILNRFAGKEAELLEKARGKYANSSV